jgi:ATP-dependent DNA helicase RecG
MPTALAWHSCTSCAGGWGAVCLLLRSGALSETARERLKLMRETNDGFVIAEKDLDLRGGGELLGLKQSGDADYRLASPEHLVRLLPIAHDDARLFVERDGGLNGARGDAMRQCLYLFERDAAVPLLRSG